MQVGTLVAARFRVEATAGRGGMATVYRATDLQDGSAAALKQIHVTHAGDVQRFMREAQLLQKLVHPGIVRYRAHGVAQDGSWFLAMDWVEGQNLAERLRQGPLSFEESVDLGVRVAEVLSVVHRAGVVHRDIKPANILVPLTVVAHATVVDFGVAHLSRTLFGTSGLTGTGAVVGTPGYLAPEQVVAEAVDGRADLFALGCVLFECITGRPAFEAPNPIALLARIALAPVESLRELRPEVPLEVDRLVAKLLAKDPAARPANAEEVLSHLRRVGKTPVGAAITPPVQRGVTPEEQQLISVVAANVRASDGDPSLSPEGTWRDPTVAQQRFRALAREHGARLELFPRTLVAVVEASAGRPGERTRRAARFALALRSEPTLGSIAMATGRGVVSRPALMGQVIDLAVAELEHAPPGLIVLDETSASLLGTHFDIDSRAGLAVLVSDRSYDSPARAVLGKETPFVGRRRELGLLSTTHEECVSEGSARAVLVTGEPGLGKSRLCQEFLLELKRAGHKPPLLFARGDPMRVGSAYAMLAAALRSACALHDDDLLPWKQERLTQRLAEVLDGPELNRVAAFLGEFLGIPFPVEHAPNLGAARLEPIVMSEQCRRAFVDWLRAEAGTGASVIIFEDLHWGDASTLQLLDESLNALAHQPLMVVALARLEVHEEFPLLRASRNFTELRLSKLSTKASGDLVRAVVGSVAPERLERIVERAAGNPFFLEELLRGAGSREGEVLPETVLGMLETRISSLAPEARLVLRAASVFGEVFWQGGVSVLLPNQPLGQELGGWLATLKAQEILMSHAASRFGGQEEYGFRHALLRDASYATLTLEDRTRGHRLAGEWLERVGESDSLVIAEHYDRGAAGDKAAAFYLRATEEALKSNDLAGAVRHAHRGRSCGTDPGVLGELHLHEGEAYTWHGEAALARDASLRAIELLPKASAQWCTAIANLGDAAMELGSWSGAEHWADELISRVEAAAPEVSHLTALGRLSFSLVLLGDRARSERAVSLLKEKIEQLDVASPLLLAHLENALAAQASIGRNRQAAARHFQSAAQSFELLGALRLASTATNNFGNMCLELGDYREASRVLGLALEIAERVRSRYARALATLNLGIAWARTGRIAEGLKLEEMAVAETLAQGDVRLEVFARCALADMLVAAGSLERAQAEARRALELAIEHKPTRAAAFSVLAHVLLCQGRAEEALVASEQGMALLLETPMEEREVQLRVCHADALARTGAPGRARAMIWKAAQIVLSELKRIDSPELRAGYRLIPEHVRTFQLCAELGVEPLGSAPTLDLMTS